MLNLNYIESGVYFSWVGRLANGSWNGDVYTTALSLRALNLADNVQLPAQPASFMGGSVIDTVDGLPVANVTVSLGDGSPEVKTRIDGTYTIFNVSPGNYTATFSLEGYISTTKNISVPAGVYVEVGAVRLELDANVAILTGFATDGTTGKPLSGVSMELTGLTTTYSTVTSENGQYHLAFQPDAGYMTLKVSKAGYGKRVFGRIYKREVTIYSPTIYLDGTYGGGQTRFIGSVVDVTTKLPIVGAKVDVVDYYGTINTVITDAEGAFYAEQFRGFNNVITISAPEYKTRVLTVFAEFEEVNNLTTVYMSRLTPVDLMATTIRGVIKDSVTKAPIFGAKVEVQGAGLATTTDSTGYYEIENIETLDFSLLIKAKGYISAYQNVSLTDPVILTNEYELSQLSVDGFAVQELTTDSQNYPAYSNVSITATLINQGDTAKSVNLLAVITDEFDQVIQKLTMDDSEMVSDNGTAISVLPGSSVVVDGRWDTGANKPGTYKIDLKAYDQFSGQLISEAVAVFSIDTTLKTNKINLVATPRFININDTAELTLTSIIDNYSNVSNEFVMSYTLSDPLGVLIKSNEVTIRLEPNETRRSIILESFPHTFVISGEYTTNIEIRSGAQPVTQSANSIIVAPSIRIEAEQDVSPSVIAPDGDKRIRIDIRLEGVSK